MAEERILIEQENDHCAKCQSYPNCDNCDYWFKSMTREEAIKKISSHLLMCDISTMDTDEIAEAALNALLEADK